MEDRPTQEPNSHSPTFRKITQLLSPGKNNTTSPSLSDDTKTRSGWYNASTTITLPVSSSVISENDGTRQVFNGWSGDASGTDLTSNPLEVDGPKTVTVNWKTQYYLTVSSEHGNPQVRDGMTLERQQLLA